MKPSEVMIGDYLLDRSGFPKKVDEVLDDGVLLGGVYHHMSEMKGVPITPKLLLEIGFCTSKRNEMHGHLTGGSSGNLYRIEYMKPTAQSGKVLGVQFLGWSGYVSKTFNLPLPEYVHELQHALKLCKIEKEIQL